MNVTVPAVSVDVVPLENSTEMLSASIVPEVLQLAVQSVAEIVALAVSTEIIATGSG